MSDYPDEVEGGTRFAERTVGDHDAGGMGRRVRGQALEALWAMSKALPRPPGSSSRNACSYGSLADGGAPAPTGAAFFWAAPVL